MTKDKPFYLNPPWEILFRESKLEKISPWSINLVKILNTLLEEMNKAGIDFRIAGIAINSSVIIYLRKAEMLLKIEEPASFPQEKDTFYLPPPLNLPYRFELTTTSVIDLINALEKVLSEANLSIVKPKPPTLPMPIPEFTSYDPYLIEIEDRSNDLLERIKAISQRKTHLNFLLLVEGLSRIEIVRVFMMLLFLAQRGEIELYQDDGEEKIMISIRGEKS
ncbi:MAG: hypothetical protein ACUVV4_01440 [Candidatus Bathyarchaeia archaeon]